MPHKNSLTWAILVSIGIKRKQLALDHGSTETLKFYSACLIDQLLIFQNDPT